MRYFSIILFFCTSSLFAQLSIRPLINDKASNSSVERTLSRNSIERVTMDEEHRMLEMPFWEDFTDEVLGIDTTLWTTYEDVSVNNTFGSAPPSFNVCTFDGVDRLFEVYAEGENNEILESKQIALKDANDEAFMSFFWQNGGVADPAEGIDGDTLYLFFQDSTGEWDTVWHSWSTDPELTGQEIGFSYQQIDLSPTYLFDGFKFRFQRTGSRDFLDFFHIDYILINDNRGGAPSSFADKAFVTAPSSPFAPYSAITREILLTDPNDALTPISVSVSNLSTSSTNSYSVNFRLANGVDSLDFANVQSASGTQSIDPRSIDTVLSQSLNASALESFVRSMTSTNIDLLVKADLNSGDTFLKNSRGETDSAVDFRVNDRVVSTYHIGDYLAYDDGTAESTLFHGRNGGFVACMYELPQLGPTTVLQSVDMHMPSFSNSITSRGDSIYVWTGTKENGPDRVIHQSRFTLQKTELNQFHRYDSIFPLSVTTTALEGVIFIGFKQSSETPIEVGFDLNNDNGTKIYSSNDGVNWKKNQEFRGSMMIRPVFRVYDNIPLLVNELVGNSLKLFPNPVVGDYLHFSREVSGVEIRDVQGRLIDHVLPKNRDVNLGKLNPGVYFVTFAFQDRLITKKVIKE